MGPTVRAADQQQPSCTPWPCLPLNRQLSTLPSVQVLGCMKIAGRAQSRAYRTLSKLFVGQFFLFRCVGSNQAQGCRRAMAAVAASHVCRCLH